MPMPFAVNALKRICGLGIPNYVFTHRGDSTRHVLLDLGLSCYIDDTVTSANGFKRKPAPDGIEYLVKKHNLDKSKAYYIGDRDIGIECAKNAGVQSIVITSEFISKQADYMIADLSRITEIITGVPWPA